MRLKVGRKCTIIIMLLTLFSLKFLNIVDLPINSNSLSYLTWIVAVLGCCIYYPGVKRIRSWPMFAV